MGPSAGYSLWLCARGMTVKSVVASVPWVTRSASDMLNFMAAWSLRGEKTQRAVLIVS